MKRYKENDLVIYKDSNGNMIDTFVIFNTDISTGLTHINHQNLKVPAGQLKLHPQSKRKQMQPMKDRYSFELFKRLREKYTNQENTLKKLKKSNTSAKIRSTIFE